MRVLADKMNTQNDLFDAIYTIATGVIESKSYDITKECKIVEIYTDTKGNRTNIYKVKSQDATYDAYAKKGETYYLNEIVYVQIPNGDFNEQKFIIGRKTSEDESDSVYNFELPFDNFLGLYSLTEYDPLEEESYGFWANCPYHGIEEEISKTDLIWSWPSQGLISDKDNIYATRLGIEVDITTLLHGYSPISGHYGFRIVVTGLGKAEGEIQLVKEYYFTDDNMYGNPYAYTDGSAQQILLNIEDFLQVQDIKIYFWQDHNFRDQLGEAIPYGEVNYDALDQEYEERKADIELNSTDKETDLLNLLSWYAEETSKTSILKNIIVNGLNVYLGILADDKEEQLVLYTYNPVNYGADPEHADVRAADRTLRLAWIHEVDKGVQLVNSQEELDKYEAKIYYYRYDEEWTPDNEEYDETNYSHKFGGLYWRPIDTEGELIKVIQPDTNRSKDRFKAVIHYGGTYITSNVLVFTNYIDVDVENANLAKNDKVILRCALLGEDSDGVTRLIDDDSIGNFFVYDENNNVLANDNNELFSNVRYYIEPWIKVTTDTDNTHDGYQRLAEYTDADGNKPDFTVTWQWPESFTMISSFGELDEEIKEESTFFNNCGVTQFDLYKIATRWFYIKPDYNVRYGNNDIAAVIHIEGYGDYTVRKTLQFGRAEAFGSEYVPVIIIGTPEGNYYLDVATDFEIYCLVYDRKGKLLEESERPNCKFIWKYIGTVVPDDNRTHENYKNFQGNVIRGRLKQAIPFVVEVTVSGAAAYDLTVRRGMMVSNSATYMQSHDIQCPDRVEFRSDGQQPLWYSSAFEVQVVNSEEQNTLIYPEWKINTTKVLQLTETTKDYPLFTLSTGQEESRDSTTEYALTMSKQYLTGSTASPAEYGQQWTDELLDPEYFTYIYYQDNDNTVTVAQAIAFARNLYASSLVNEWDGQSLSLDEENSAILSKMISAGTKDSKNRFTGVMMGDWHEKGDESLETPGLYGFSGGAQTFGFKTDGTGFIGGSGYGRIEFDGRNALISNPTKTCYMNLNPRIFSFTDEHKLANEVWDGIGSQGYSQYFLYCELPQSEQLFTALESEDGVFDSLWWLQNTWAKGYLTKFQEQNKDFFIVDPNNGVLTTGGIFARFGQIGMTNPWVICDNGLTQQNIFGTIFLGDAEKNPSKNNSNIIQPSYLNKNNEEITTFNFFSISLADISNIIQSGFKPDGFFYTKYANIGGWCINDKELYAPAEGGFRKNYNIVDGQDESGNDIIRNDGYINDYINLCLDSDRMTMSFNKGRMTINGAEGWLGSYKEGIAITKPDAYDVFIDFNKGSLNFFKKQGSLYPYVKIDGSTGVAYFAKGNIVIDAESSTIYCGKPVNDLDGTTNTNGTIQLADISINGITGGSSTYNFKQNLTGFSITSNEADTEDAAEILDFATSWGSASDGSNTYLITDDENYVNGKTYYTKAADNSYSEFTPTFLTDITAIPFSVEFTDSSTTPLTLSIETGNDLIDKKLGINRNQTGTYSYTFTRDWIQPVEETTTQDVIVTDEEGNLVTDDNGNVLTTQTIVKTIKEGTDCWDVWKYNNEEVNWADWYITSPADEDNSFLLLTIQVYVKDWDNLKSTLYEKAEDFNKLTSLKRTTTTVVDANNLNTVEIIPTGSLTFYQDNKGMQLLIAPTASSDTVILQPTATLGVLKDWEINAPNIIVDGIARVNKQLIIQDGVMYVKNDAEGNPVYSRLATESWVDNYIVENVWPKIKSVNNSAVAAMKKAKAALSAVSAANAAIEAKAITRFIIALATPGGSQGKCYIQLTGYNSALEVVAEGESAMFAGVNHRHNCTLQINSGSLEATVGELTGSSPTTSSALIFDSNRMKFSESNGKISLTLTIAGKTATKNFNMASTNFYQTHAFGSLDVSAGSSNAATFKVTSLSGATLKTLTSSLKLDTGNKKVNQSVDGTTVASISVSDVYNAGYTQGETAGEEAGYKAGWNACIDSMESVSAVVNVTNVGYKYLYSKSGDEYTSEGNHYWRYGGSTGTYYKKPSKK